MIKDAKFSDCGKYRFWLKRIWDEELPQLQLIGLNPSTANAETDDPTIRRVAGTADRNWLNGLAAANGYGGIWMTNLFPFITAYPSELRTDDIGISLNDFVLRATAIYCRDVCFCWGNFDVLGRDKVVMEMFPDALCFGKNKNGSPKHPLYLKSTTELIKYTQP